MQVSPCILRTISIATLIIIIITSSKISHTVTHSVLLVDTVTDITQSSHLPKTKCNMHD